MKPDITMIPDALQPLAWVEVDNETGFSMCSDILIATHSCTDDGFGYNFIYGYIDNALYSDKLIFTDGKEDVELDQIHFYVEI
jgi:hypothetical protein